MSEYNIQMNKYNALSVGYDQLYPATKIEDVNGLDTALQNNDPRNWGLGSMDGKTLTTDDDLDNIIINGWYSWASTSPTNAPVQYGRMILFGYSNTVTQIVSSDMLGWKNILVMRSRFQGTWSPWEYVNPPMQLGIEYRTTERYLGKPVYEKAINVSVLPSAGSYVAPDHNIANFGYCVECCGSLVNGTSIPYVNINREGQILLGVNSVNIRIYSDLDISALTAVVKIKYTKTTD